MNQEVDAGAVLEGCVVCVKRDDVVVREVVTKQLAGAIERDGMAGVIDTGDTAAFWEEVWQMANSCLST